MKLVRCFWCGDTHTYGYRINSRGVMLFVCEQHWDILQWTFG